MRMLPTPVPSLVLALNRGAILRCRREWWLERVSTPVDV
jgi:hypothetical protein